MQIIDTEYLERCAMTLEQALERLRESEVGSISYDLYRSACIKEFEIILEQAGKLLKKALTPYFPVSGQADRLFFKDIFRYAAKYRIIQVDQAERWLQYRENRNTTTHDYGAGFAEETLRLLPQFLEDTDSLIKAIKNHNDITAKG